jgi:hypothetical protein
MPHLATGGLSTRRGCPADKVAGPVQPMTGLCICNTASFQEEEEGGLLFNFLKADVSTVMIASIAS